MKQLDKMKRATMKRGPSRGVGSRKRKVCSSSFFNAVVLESQGGPFVWAVHREARHLRQAQRVIFEETVNTMKTIAEKRSKRTRPLVVPTTPASKSLN